MDEILRLSNIYSENNLDKLVRKSNINASSFEKYLDRILSNYNKKYPKLSKSISDKIYDLGFFLENFFCHNLKSGIDREIYAKCDDQLMVF